MMNTMINTKTVLALTAIALTFPVAGHAETVTKITRISEPNVDAARAVTVYQSEQYGDALERMRARAAYVEDEAVPPGHKVTKVYKGSRVTTTYITPSAPVSSGPNTWPTHEVWVEPDGSTSETVIYTEPSSGIPMPEPTGEVIRSHKVIKFYND